MYMVGYRLSMVIFAKAAFCQSTLFSAAEALGTSPTDHLIISGSTDCTVRTWSLDSGDSHISVTRELEHTMSGGKAVLS